jgi:hypothetical protein
VIVKCLRFRAAGSFAPSPEMTLSRRSRYPRYRAAKRRCRSIRLTVRFCFGLNCFSRNLFRRPTGTVGQKYDLARNSQKITSIVRAENRTLMVEYDETRYGFSANVYHRRRLVSNQYVTARVHVTPSAGLAHFRPTRLGSGPPALEKRSFLSCLSCKNPDISTVRCECQSAR